MTGKAYYITTLADWQRYAPRFANSHFIVLDAAPSAPTPAVRHSERSDRTDVVRPGHAGTSDRAVEESLFHSVPEQEFATKKGPSASSGEPVLAGGEACQPARQGSVASASDESETPQQIPRTETLRGPRNDNAGEAGADAEKAAPKSAPVEGQGFSPDTNDGRIAPSALPQAPPSVEAQGFSPAKNDAPQAPSDAQLHPQHVFEVQSHASRKMDKDADFRILVLIEADEGVHLSLEDEPAFQPLPHPLAQKPISDAAQAALAPHGVAPGATTFDAAEALSRIHPLLKHRVF